MWQRLTRQVEYGTIPRFLVISFLIMFAINLVRGQAPVEPIVVKSAPSACELNSLYADWIRGEVLNSNQRIFVISRPGNKEAKNVNEKRLTVIKAFLQKRKGWEQLSVVYAQGERVSGPPQIEFYVNGELYLVILTKTNTGPCMDCCDFDYLSAPGNLVRRRGKRT